MQGQGPPQGGGFRPPPNPIAEPFPSPQGGGAPQGYAAAPGGPPPGYARPPQPQFAPPIGVPPMLGYYGPTQTTDGKAIAALALGAASFVTCVGALAGIPAIVLGIVAARDISRSQGATGGKGMAITGILLGAASTAMTLLYVGFIFMHATPAFTPTPFPTYTPPAPSMVSHEYVGTADVHRALGPSLTAIIADEAATATLLGKTLLVQTTGALCSKSCPEVRRAIRDRSMQDLFSQRAVLLEVSADKYESELGKLGIPTFAGPMFFLVGSDGRVRDLISADEWDDNTARNIAPILEDFVAGTLVARKVPNPRTPPPAPSATVVTPPEDDDYFSPKPPKKKPTKM